MSDGLVALVVLLLGSLVLYGIVEIDIYLTKRKGRK